MPGKVQSALFSGISAFGPLLIFSMEVKNDIKINSSQVGSDGKGDSPMGDGKADRHPSINPFSL